MRMFIIITLLAASLGLSAEEPKPALQTIPQLKGCTLAQGRTTDGQMAMFQQKVITLTDGRFGEEDEKRRLLTLPPEFYSVQSLYVEGDVEGDQILAYARGSKSVLLQGDLSVPSNEFAWVARSHPKLPRYGQAELGSDAEGRLCAIFPGTSSRAPFVPLAFFQEVVGGPLRMAKLPYPARRVKTLRDGDRGFWIFQNRLHLSLAGKNDEQVLCRFRQGQIDVWPLEGPCVNVVPVSDALLFVSIHRGDDFFIDRDSGARVAEGPFDPAILKGLDILNHQQASEDDSVWMVGQDANDARRRQGELWRWHDGKLERRASDLELKPSYTGWPIVALDADRAVVANGKGLLWVSGAERGMIDWRHGLNDNMMKSLQVIKKENTLLAHGMRQDGYRLDLARLENMTEREKPADRTEVSHQPVVANSLKITPEGPFAVVIDDDGAANLMRLTGDTWETMAPYPKGYSGSELYAIARDARDRLWLLNGPCTKDVMVRETGKDWRIYSNLMAACEAELTLGQEALKWCSAPGMQIETDAERIWIHGSSAGLQVWSKAEGWIVPRHKQKLPEPPQPAHSGLISVAPRLLKAGAVAEDIHLLFMDQVYALSGTQLVATAYPSPHRLPPALGVEQLRQQMRQVVFRGQGRVEQASPGAYQTGANMYGGYQWTWNHQTRQIQGVQRERKVSIPLEGTRLSTATSPQALGGRDGRLWLADRNMSPQDNQLFVVRSGLSNLQAQVEIVALDGAIEIRLSGLNVPEEDIVMLTSLNYAVLKEGQRRYDQLVTGEYAVRVLLAHKEELVWFDPVEKTVRVESDLQGRIPQLIKELGSEDFRLRTAAEKKLRAIGVAAIPRLEAATGDKDVERRMRAIRVLDSIPGGLNRLPKLKDLPIHQ